MSRRTPCIQDDRERCGASVRAVARSSLFPLSLPLSLLHLLTISLPTSLKGDGELAREGKRKRVNQVECVPERGEGKGDGGATGGEKG